MVQDRRDAFPSLCHAGRMSTEIEADAAAMRQAMDRAVHLIGCGHVEEARRLLSAYLSGVNPGRALLRASELDRERAARCLREHLGPMIAALERGETPDARGRLREPRAAPEE